MKKLAILSAVVVIGLGSLASTGAEAQSRRGAAVAAGVIGGLAAGALIGAAASNAYAAPGYYGYGYAPGYYGYSPSSYGYGYGYPTSRVVSSYGYSPTYYEDAYVPPRRVYRQTRVVRTYDPYAGYYRARPSVSVGFGFGTPSYGYYGW
jgi:hypothetical protein